MNKRLMIPTLALGFASGFGIKQDAQDSDLKAQINALEERLETVEGYLASQAEADKAVAIAVDKAVEQGFTSGINFEARKTLVGAWKARVKASGKNLPGQKTKPAAKSVDPRLTRRRK